MLRAGSTSLIAIVTLAAAAVAAPIPAPSVDVFSPLVIVTGNGVEAMPPGSIAPVAITQTQVPNGPVEVTGASGKTSVVYFGPGLGQAFTGFANAFAFARADVGYVRISFAVDAGIAPSFYGQGTVGAQGFNQYQSYAGIGVTGSFWDVVIPPATAGKTTGAATTLTVKPQLNCTYAAEGGCAHCTPLGTSGGALVSITYFQLDGTTQIGAVVMSFTGICPMVLERALSGFTVGTPVLMRYQVTLQGSQIAGWAIPTPFGPERSERATLAFDALNTGFVTITDADGNPVTGQSGVTYSGEPVLDPITTTTTTSTTSTTFMPPTTLPGCSPDAYCGDGVYQPECGEACECPPPSPGQTATICTAAVALPNLAQACALCTGCQVDLSGCVTTTTTAGPTTTLVDATTTTVGAPTTTSTTLPGSPCAGRSGFDGVQCVCSGGLTPLACAADHVPAAIGKLFVHGCTLMQHAQSLSTGKKVKRIVRSARATFAKDVTRVARAGSAKKHPLPADCASALANTVDDVRTRTDEIVAAQP